MGHVIDLDREHRLLQQQMDCSLTGAPESPVFLKILQLLFSAEEAAIARRLPSQLISIDALSRRVGLAEQPLRDKLEVMAQRGIVLDVEHEGQRWYALAPVAFGFFEFTFMRVRDDVSMVELSRLFEQYLDEDDRLARSVFEGSTQPGRAFVCEEALSDSDRTEVLDWERASRVIESASAIAISLCACRHKASHLGRACAQAQKVCMAFNYGAEYVIRHGLGERVTVAEGMQILEACKQAGLAQLGDNVQRKVTYLCNCCGCCCEMIQSLKRFNLRKSIVTSNWLMEVDDWECSGCGRCVSACPLDAITMHEEDGGKGRRWAVPDEALCIGCGVCSLVCKVGAIHMRSREARVCAPETVFDRMAMMAIERGKLSELIFDNPQRLSFRALRRLVQVLERAPLIRAAMAIGPLRSTFLSRLVAEGKRRAGNALAVLQ